MLDRQDISGAHANTLRNALNSPSPITSDPKIVSDLRGDIALLRFKDPDSVAITERARVMREQLAANFTGADTSGNSVPKTLTGNDFEELMGLVDEYENIALGQGGQRYATAMRTIKAFTGYSDAMNAKYEGRWPVGQAYAAFTIALQDYMDLEGVNAKPEEFVMRNKQNYTADIYFQSLHARLNLQYPEFAGLFEKLLINQTVADDPDKPTDGVYVTGAHILNKALDRVRRNVMDRDRYEELRRSLMFLTYSDEPYEAPTFNKTTGDRQVDRG